MALNLLPPQGGTVYDGSCLFVCLSVNDFVQKSYQRISMKFSGSVGGPGGGTRNNPLDFGSYQ